MDTYFNCTQCGKCCRDTKIPLTVTEAISWLNRGDKVGKIKLTSQDQKFLRALKIAIDEESR